MHDLPMLDEFGADLMKETTLLNNLKPSKPKHVVILGDEQSGKSTLVRKVFSAKSWSSGSSLMYGVEATRDLHGNKDQARLSVWVLKGSRDFQEKARILKYALTADRLQDTLVLLVTPADKLQNLTLCLEYYSNLLLEHIRSFGLSEETFNKPPATSHFFQRGEQALSTLACPSSENSTIDAGIDMNAVKVNLGLPVIVVVTKADVLSSLVGEYDFQAEHFDFMQKQLRTFCLNHDAALVHTSAKNDVNCKLLYQYTVEWVTNQSFSRFDDEMDIVDSIFSPNSWDREMKSRRVLFGNGAMINEDRFESFLDKLPSLTQSPQKAKPELIEAEEDSVFLARIQSCLTEDDSIENPETVVTYGCNACSPLFKAEGNVSQPEAEPVTPDSQPCHQIELAKFFSHLIAGKSAAKSRSRSSTPSRRRYSLVKDQSLFVDSQDMNDLV